ncbi:hydrogenase 4 subunit F [Acidithiobacillus sp. AMEEHan]|uniref:hydrogenase 4 subunit F n=1 Tax=Acidithiobacillus sp. AMEEHan TaxID=2994951 RepID=UPI0027E5363A|nr:hydrogenase 4 subunit F [Acidithiobacillus sp. AMEEHan]
MTLLWILVAAAAGIPLLALLGDGRRGRILFVGINLVVFMLSLLLAKEFLAHGTLRALDDSFRMDALSLILVLVNGLVGLMTAWFSSAYWQREISEHGFGKGRQRLYHAMFQSFLATMLLALLSNNLGILWVALEGATLSTVLLVSMQRSAESLEAAWKYFILCGVGLAMALFGTVLLYFAAQPVLGSGARALLWSALDGHAKALNGTALALAFVFVLVGYGTKVGLAPLNSWLPDAHAAGPSTVSAVLSGLLLNVALYAILRFKSLADAALGSAFASHLLLAFGLLSLLLAALSMLRQHDVKRLFAYSSVEHMGLISIAFGLGGPLAIFAGVLHMVGHSLAKSSVFFSVGRAIQEGHSRELADLRGILQTRPTLGWSLLLSIFAILGMPPGSLFLSEFLIVVASVQQMWMITPILLLGLGVAFAAILPRLLSMLYGEATPVPAQRTRGLVPVFVQILVVVLLGIWIPGSLNAWMHSVAGILQ